MALGHGNGENGPLPMLVQDSLACFLTALGAIFAVVSWCEHGLFKPKPFPKLVTFAAFCFLNLSKQYGKAPIKSADVEIIASKRNYFHPKQLHQINS